MAALSVLVGKRIKEIRESKNIKQNELAELIDIEATNLSKLEKGVHLPKEETIQKITKALNVTIKDLFDFEHIRPREVLLQNINEILKNASDSEIQFFYKILVASKELK
ncbi:MAG: helix-turn-helix transcriptional regulator, partial [bacterium]|nr:helix-turn-helix transcriptional regulator [bacterium]